MKPRFSNWQLFAVCVLVWGTTWHAITHQIDTVAAEVAVAFRFTLAGLAALAIARWRGESLIHCSAAHAWFALQGVFMYGVAYVAVYHAEIHVPSGLVAVAYSASPLLAGLGAQVVFGVPVTRRFVAGGLLGLLGVVLIFWPELGAASDRPNAGRGLAFTIAAVFLSAVGSVAASRNRVRGLPLWPALGFGMLYGAATAAVVAVALGRSFALPATTPWWTALLYLALAGSVLAFACFLELQHRIGPGPASAIGVMTPIIALAVSIGLEGYRPDGRAGAGAALAVLGNFWMLRRPPRPSASAAG
ncbi:MAG: DMT family transporter [Verrucomicrobiales bacterium]